MAFYFVQTFNLLAAHFRIVNFKNVDGVFVVKTVFVDTYDSLTATVDTCLRTCGGFLDAEFGKTGFDSFRHSSESLDFLDVCPRTMSDFICEGFHIVAAAPRVDLFGD